MNPAKRLAIESVRRLGLIKPAFRLYQEWVALKTWAVESEFRAPDGLPMPPPRLRVMVAGTADPEWFLDFGVNMYAAIRTAFGNANSVLDFGCGCGRVLRYWKDSSDLHGCDINPTLANWCQANLPFASVQVTGEPPLPYDNARFDAAYCVSVFTHLTESEQRKWMRELARVIKPNGQLLITTIGGETSEVIAPEASGMNICIAVHTQQTVTALTKGLFHVEQFRQATSKLPQDTYLLRRLTA